MFSGSARTEGRHSHRHAPPPPEVAEEVETFRRGRGCSSPLRSCTDLYLVPVAGEDAEAGYEDEDPLLECDIIVKEETESD